MRSVSAVVIVGDQNGSAGVGMGRGIDTQLAVAKASAQAEKNMTPFPRLENRTIFSDIDYKFHNVNLKLGMAKPGTRVNLGHGIVANNYIHEICRCIGISDMTGKVYGSNNPMNVIKGTFAALASQKRPDEIALARGKKVMDVERTYYGTRLS